MRIGILDVNIKRGKPGQCWVCKKPIELKELHAVVVLRYGKFQQQAFKLAAAQGRAKSKRAGFKYRRLHLKDCLAVWLIAIHHYRTEARSQRQGRPKGSGQLTQMSDEERLVRYRLVRRRAATLRLIMKEEDDARGRQLILRLRDLNKQLGENEVIEVMSHRSSTEIRLLNEKIVRFVHDQPAGTL